MLFVRLFPVQMPIFFLHIFLQNMLTFNSNDTYLVDKEHHLLAGVKYLHVEVVPRLRSHLLEVVAGGEHLYIITIITIIIMKTLWRP